MQHHSRHLASLRYRMEVDTVVDVADSNAQTIRTRMCRFHRGLKLFRANHNIISIPEISYELYDIENCLKHQ